MLVQSNCKNISQEEFFVKWSLNVFHLTGHWEKLSLQLSLTITYWILIYICVSRLAFWGWTTCQGPIRKKVLLRAGLRGKKIRSSWSSSVIQCWHPRMHELGMRPLLGIRSSCRGVFITQRFKYPKYKNTHRLMLKIRSWRVFPTTWKIVHATV